MLNVKHLRDICFVTIADSMFCRKTSNFSCTILKGTLMFTDNIKMFYPVKSERDSMLYNLI